MNRAIDCLISCLIIILSMPALLLTSIAIKISSKGPIFFISERVGLHGVPFKIFKFRSMHLSVAGPEITSANDLRVFPVGKLIRRLKLDELPQFLNVLRGDMAIVGPRPESPVIVAGQYEDWMLKSLEVRPGITSPGSIFYYAHAEKWLTSGDPEEVYVTKILPTKIALDLAYAERANVVSNLFVVLHTAVSILAKVVGVAVGPLARDLAASNKWYETKI